MHSVERRSFVRGNFSFKVKFKTMTPHEYEDLKSTNEVLFSPFIKSPSTNVDKPGVSIDRTTDASLISYLVQMDEKLNQILEILAKENKVEGLFAQGVGLNISGTGMNIMVDKPVESGMIIHSKFYLSKSPLIFMDMFGEVIRVEKINECGNTSYSVGIKFLDLSVNDREQVIASVFQRQRGNIRKRKNA